jgi:hypothetical protein
VKSNYSDPNLYLLKSHFRRDGTRNSSVSRVIRLLDGRLRDQGSIPNRAGDLLPFTTFSPAGRLIQPSLSLCLLGTGNALVKRWDNRSDHPLPSNAEVKRWDSRSDHPLPSNAEVKRWDSRRDHPLPSNAEVKRWDSRSDHPLPSNAEVKNVRSLHSVPRMSSC